MISETIQEADFFYHLTEVSYS